MTTATLMGSVCTRIADRIAHTVGPDRYAMWFARSVKLAYEDASNRLVLSVPNRFVADWISRHFEQDIAAAAAAELKQSVTLTIDVDPALFPAPGTTGTLSEPAGVEGGSSVYAGTSDHAGATPSEGAATAPGSDSHGTRRRPWQTNRAGRAESGAGLRYRLEDFVVGPSNAMAHAAAVRLAEDEHAAHPLFLHGGNGLGKTHLLQGLCRRLLSLHPHARVHYTTGEQFTNDFLAAIRNNKLDEFRRRTRRLDLLAVDDVHFIANKEKTQQEFLHSFNAIELEGARIVMASDCHPKVIQQFSDALVSRCVRGLVVEINPPDTATRTKLIQTMAAQRRMNLIPSVVATLAAQTHGSVRELEGMLTKLQALSELTGDKRDTSTPAGQSPPIGQALIHRLLQSDLPATPARAVHMDQIFQAVVETLQVSRADILASGRQRMHVLARSLVIYLGRQMTRMSYPEIAAALGRVSHSTIVTADQRLQQQLQENPTLMLRPDKTQPSQPTALHDLVESLKHQIARMH